MNIRLSEIEIDSATQSRAKINQDVVDEYAEYIFDWCELPAITVFYDGSKYYIADGYHRYYAHKKLKLLEIEAEVIEGTKRDAILYSFNANSKHGLRRTNEDKRKSVLIMLNDEEWKLLSDRKISEYCAVSVPFVGAIRRPEVKEKQDKHRKNNNHNSSMGVIGLHPQEQHGYSDENKESEIEQINKELSDEIISLEEENKKLKDSLAVNQLPDDVEIQSAEEIIEELREEVKTLRIKLQAVSDSRDSYMREVTVLKDQCNRQAKQLKKLGERNNA